MPARPLAIRTVLGSCAGNMRAIHSLCRPTSEISMSSRPSALRISHSARGGCIGNASSSLADSKRPRMMSLRRESRGLVRRVAQLLGQAGEDVVEVADQVALGHEVLVDLDRGGVDADDLLVLLGVPVLRGVLDEVVADRDHDVGVLEARERVVARLQPDRPERARVLVVEQPLAHERLRHADPGGARELAQRRRRADARDAVAGQHDRVDRRADDRDRLQQLLRGGLGAADVGARGQRLGVDLSPPSRPRAARCGSGRASGPARP